MGSQQQATIRFVVSTADAEHDLKLFHKRVEAETKIQQDSQIKAQASPENVRYQKDAEFHAEKLYKLKRQEHNMIQATGAEAMKFVAANEKYDKQKIDHLWVQAKAEDAIITKRRADYDKAERAMYLEQNKEQNKPEGKGGMRGALSGFGGKMIMAHAGGMVAGDILGDQHGGREVGAAIGAMMFGGPYVAAAVVGLEAVGTLIRRHREELQAANTAALNYQNTLSSVAAGWANASSGLVHRDSFGKAMEEQYEQSTEAARKHYEAAEKIKTSHVGDLVGGLSPAEAKAMGGELEQGNTLSRMAGQARKNEDVEYATHMAEQTKLLKREREDYIKEESAMPGLLKQQFIALSQINQKGLELNESHRSDMSLMIARLNFAEGEYEMAEKYNYANKDILKTERDRLLILQQRLAKQQSVETYKVELDYAHKKNDFALQFAINRQKEISNTNTPQGRAASLQIYKMQMEEFEKEGATKNELAVISDKLLGIDKLRTDTAKEQIKLDYESYKITAQEADVRRMMADTQFRDNREVQQAIKARADMNEKEQTTLDILRYQKDIKKLDIEYQEKRHMISQRDADVQKMILADRRAQDELMNNPKGGPIVQQIIALADAMQKLRMAEITHVGLFSGAYSPGRVNFRALNQNRPYGALQGPGQFTDKYTAATNVTGLNKDFQSPLNKLYSQPLPVILSGGLPPGAVPAASPAGGTSQTDAAQDAKKTTKKIKMNAAQLDWLAQDKILNPKETHPKYDESGNLISGTPLKYHTTHTVGGEGWVPTPMNELMDNARGGKKDSVDHDAAQTSLLTTIAAHLGIIVQNGGLN